MGNRGLSALGAGFASVLFALCGPAVAGDAFSSFSGSQATILCDLGGGRSGCSQFQGYVYVTRGARAQTPSSSALLDDKGASDPVLSAHRLYLNDASETH